MTKQNLQKNDKTFLTISIHENMFGIGKPVLFATILLPIDNMIRIGKKQKWKASLVNILS